MNKTVTLINYISDFLDFEIVKSDNKLITNFTNKWFSEQQEIKDERFTQYLNKNKLAINPHDNQLLSTLLYLVFEETGELPSTRYCLYKEGLEILLKKWDNTSNIEQNQLYKRLSVQRKQNLLSQIALKTFEQNNYCFSAQELKQYITDYICNLPDAQTNLELLQQDSEAVLKSIEAQHEILVELAPGIYSFSLLAFHEYFTAKEIIDSSSPEALEKALQILSSHITEPRWHEVFLLVAGMLRNAEYLLTLIKHQADKLVASDEKIQQFIATSNNKITLENNPYKLSALRAFNLECVLELNFDFARILDCNLAYDLDFNLARVHIYTDELKHWQFSEQQKKTLKQYYDANKLLADCLINAHYITRSVREEIENTLLLPSEIL